MFKAIALEPGTVLTVNSHDRERDLILHMRPTGTPQPLVMIFHGGGGGARFMARRTGALADQLLDRGYAIAFMNGSSRFGGKSLRTWNGGHCCAYALKAKIDEVDYIDRVVAAIAAQMPLDHSRVFLMGHSNGGMIAYRSPAEMATQIRGIVVISSAMFDDQPLLNEGMSAFLIHTRDDANIAFDASVPPKNRRAWNALPLPFREAELRMKKMLGCGNLVRENVVQGVVRRNHSCAKGADLTIVVSATGGHEWPKSIPGFDLDEAILEFFDNQH